MKRALVAWSGGKDSSLALRELRRQGEYEPVGLLTTLTREHQRISMHGVRLALLEAQAHSLGLAVRPTWIPVGCDDQTYRDVMQAAMDEARADRIDAIVFGDLFLEDVRQYRETMLDGTGISPLFPLWGRPTDALARDFIDSGFRAVLACVDTDQISGDFAGRAYDHALLADLPGTADPCGERGEFHTFVHDGPGFKEPVALQRGETVLRDERFMYCDLLPSSSQG